MFWTRRKSFWANKKGQGTLEVVFGLVQNVLDLSKLIVPNKIEWVQNSFESIKGMKVPKYTLFVQSIMAIPVEEFQLRGYKISLSFA